jgi:ABC-type glycerol-3-phosphate transport system substrate-binding protein
MRTTIVAALVCGLLMGCSKSDSEAPAATAPEATTGAEATTPPDGATTESVLATQPEATKVKTEITKLTYPATREQILAATAQSPDFTASEKKYLTETLPAGNYGTAEEVLNALKVQ